MNDLERWIDAALTVADTTGMQDSQIIPTWPSDVAGFYPTLTIGALREWKEKNAQVDPNTEAEARIDIPGCSLTLGEAFDQTFKQVLRDLERIFPNSQHAPFAKNVGTSASVPDEWISDIREAAKHIAEFESGPSQLAGALYRISDGLSPTVTAPQPAPSTLQDVASQVCGELPEGWELSLCMENGAAWVETVDPHGEKLELDSPDSTLADQIHEALAEAIRQKGE